MNNICGWIVVFLVNFLNLLFGIFYGDSKAILALAAVATGSSLVILVNKIFYKE